jgi:glycine cleavage system H protein
MALKVPPDLKYYKEHEWVRMQNDIAVIGITDYAQHALTDIVFIELPEVGKRVAQGESLAVVESVKAASDVFSPLSGEVVEVNSELADAPQLMNEDPYGKGWIVKLKIADRAELDTLMDAKAYAAYTEKLEKG